MEPNHLVFGSFNHTRKLTSTSQQRFGEVLCQTQMRFFSFAVIPSMILLFVVIFFSGLAIWALLLINCNLLPYAPSSAEAMSDYGAFIFILIVIQ